jgi:hypothetical protein
MKNSGGIALRPGFWQISPMIISASRRTDIPAHHAEWFMERIRAGFCRTPNPFNPAMVSRISLAPADVDLLVFWSRFPRPLLPHLDELDQRGLRHYMLFTLMDNPRALEPGGPETAAALDTFLELSQRTGPDKVIWRYDPILIGGPTPVAFHLETFARLARALRGATRRCIFSFADFYPSVRQRLAAHGLTFHEDPRPFLPELLPAMNAIAQENGLSLQTCAENLDLTPWQIPAGACIDAGYIRATFGLNPKPAKDRGQRPHCRCIASRDIGTYGTCPHGCLYCYAARKRHGENPSTCSGQADCIPGENGCGDLGQGAC